MTARDPSQAPAEPGFAEAPFDFKYAQAATAGGAAPLDAALMSSVQVKRLLACEPHKHPPFIVDAELFNRRRHAYLAARAALEDPEKEKDNETGTLLDSAFYTAELLLLATPAALPWQVWAKLEVLEETITDDLRDGQHAAPRVLMALASFKNDLIRFDFGPGEHPYAESI